MGLIDVIALIVLIDVFSGDGAAVPFCCGGVFVDVRGGACV